MSSPNTITIIITTKDNQRTISRCIESILKQSYFLQEIIIVDNFSKDKTVELIKKIISENKKNIKNSIEISFYQKGPERSAQRNFALAKVTTDFFMIVDSDQYLSPTVLENCILAIEKKKVAMVAIPEKNIENSLLSKLLNMERNIITRKMNKDIPRFFSFKIIKKVGFLSEEISFGEDLDFKMRAIEKGFDYSVIVDKIIHDEKDNLISLIKKFFYYGKTSNNPQKKNRKKYYQNYLLLQPQFFFNFFYYLIHHPLLTVLAILLRGVKILCFVLGTFFRKKIKIG